MSRNRTVGVLCRCHCRSTSSAISFWEGYPMMRNGFCAAGGQSTRMWQACALSLVLGVGAARAQAPSLVYAQPIGKHTNVTTVNIFLDTRMDCARAPSKVWVVVDDVDLEVDTTPIPGGWKAETRKLDAVQGHVSLRVGSKPPARTDCRKYWRLARQGNPPDWV